MHSLKLILSGDTSKAKWLLEWDESHFNLTSPGGDVAFETSAGNGYWLVGSNVGQSHVIIIADYQLYSFTPVGSVRKLKELVAHGLRIDPEYRMRARLEARQHLRVGLRSFIFAACFAAGGILFLASVDDPIPVWLLLLRWVFRIGFLFCFAGIVYGLALAFTGFRQIRRVWAAERDPRVVRIEFGSPPDAPPQTE